LQLVQPDTDSLSAKLGAANAQMARSVAATPKLQCEKKRINYALAMEYDSPLVCPQFSGSTNCSTLVPFRILSSVIIFATRCKRLQQLKRIKHCCFKEVRTIPADCVGGFL
jgi:hypothetical protein